MTKENVKIDGKAEKIYGLTPIQEGMLFNRLLETDGSSYFLQNTMEIKGDFDFASYQKAIRLLAEKHEILRCLLAYRKVANPIMIIIQNRWPEINYYEITDKVDPLRWLHNFKKKDKKRNFDFERETLFRSAVIKLAERHYQVVWSFHHIIVDGWSIALLTDDFKKLYASIAAGTGEETLRNEILHFHSLTGTFEQHVKWIKGQNYAEGIEYWAGYLKGYDGNTQILPILPGKGREISEISTRISPVLYEKLVERTREYCVTVNAYVETAFGVLLQRYCGNDVVYGKVISGRNSGIKNIEAVAGLFINTVPQRMTNDGHMTFKELLYRVREDNVTNERYNFCSLADIQNKIGNHAGLVKILYVFENYLDASEQQGEGLTFTSLEESEQTEYDLTFSAYEDDVLCFGLEYNKSGYDRTEALRILSRFVKVLEIAVTAPDSPVAEYDFLLEDEARMVLEDFNRSEMDQPAGTVVELFYEQARKTPDRVALTGRTRMTYREMDEKSNILANKLIALGIKPGDFVAIMAVRSPEMILGIYAVLKAGAAYVPIDPAYPPERSRFIVEDCQPGALLLYEGTAECEIPVINLGNSASFIGDATPPAVRNQPDDPIYVIYTSGTTGTPKGVVNRHGGIYNLLNWMQQEYPLAETDAILFKTTYMFDVSASEIFWWSIAGARLVILEAEAEKEPAVIIKTIYENKVTVVNFAPSMLAVFVNEAAKEKARMLRSLRYVIAAGEALDVGLANRTMAVLRSDSGNTTVLANLYGPTEASVYTTYYNCRTEEQIIPIGKPIGNVKIYILQGLHVCGIGIPGELCIAGAGLAAGYWHLEQLTAEKFIDNPFGPGKLYRTGDLARWLPDGTIDYLGRIDQQVKIRGFRIELGEIASAIRKIDTIKDCAVTVSQDAGADQAINAYLVADCPIDPAAVKEKLQAFLPAYMIPAYMMQLETIPVTGNGKLDRRALPVIEIQSGQEYVAPRNELETLVCELFAELLKVARVGIKDNFFDLGGHSLKAIRLMNRLEAKAGKNVLLKQVFEAATPEKIAALYSAADSPGEKAYEPIPRAPERDTYRLTSMQQRIYLLNQYAGDSITYNMPQVYRLHGEVDIDRLRAAVEQLIARHDVLRTRFVVVDGQVYQSISPRVAADFSYLPAAGQTEAAVIKDFCRPFDLEQAPLMRVQLVKRPADWLFLLDIHHIICDGISIEILLEELSVLYNAVDQLPAARQYIDYSEWMRGKDLSAQRTFWLSQFHEEVPVYNMPTDFTRKQSQDFGGAEIGYGLERRLGQRIKDFIRENDLTESMFFLAAVSILLSRYGYQEEIVLGSPVSNRVHADTEKMLGMFVNTIALRMDLSLHESFVEYASRVKTLCMKAYENQEFPFDELVSAANIVRDSSRNPLFDVMYHFQNTEEEPLVFDGFTLEEIKHDFKTAKFDLTFTISPHQDSYQIVLEYCTGLYSAETAQKMVEYMENLLLQLVTDPSRPIHTYEINSMTDKLRIMDEFNATAATYDRSQTVVGAFAEIAGNYPDYPAILLDGRQITYRQLDQMSDALAVRLRDMGVDRDKIVALYCERSMEMIAGMLAVMKAGGAYVPIDIHYPGERVDYILQDASPVALLTFHADIATTISKIDLGDPGVWNENTTGTDAAVLPNDLAYVIYTSGTTGRPKGVMLEHRGVLSMNSFLRRMHGLNPADRILQFANYVFDASVWEIVMALLNGAALVMVTEKMILAPDEFKHYVEKNGVTHTLLPPYYYLQTDLRGLRTVTTGGSASNPQIVEKAIKHSQYINAYGPTENTVLATYWPYAANQGQYDCIPIGKPVDNTRIYIMDHDNVCGIGVPGELCITGDGLARGYLNQEELTAEKFVDNPFGDGKMYRSGDLARWLPDGNIDFLGRIDKQVKIRGFRIELSEIENVIRDLDAVTDAVVITRKSSDNADYLCAYIIAEETVDPERIKLKIAEKLPEYMIPAHITQIAEIPLTQSGKLNIAALPAEVVKAGEYMAPRNEKEAIVCQVLEEVLGIRKVGINDNFFEMGGNSITAIQIISRISAMGMKISVKDILSAKKPILIAVRLKETTLTYSQQMISGYIKPTVIQEDFLQKWHLAEPEYFNQTLVLRGRNIVAGSAMNALTAVINHHDILRAVVRVERQPWTIDSESTEAYMRDNVERIYIRPPQEQPLFDWYEVRTDSRDEMERQCEQIQKSFSLSEGPLVKAVYIRLDAREYIMLCIHHLVVDIISWNIIVEDFTLAYEQDRAGKNINLPLKSLSVAEWGNRVMQLKASPDIAGHEYFWQDMLCGCDGERFLDPDRQGRSEIDYFVDDQFTLDEEITAKLLYEVNRKLSTKTTDILLAALVLAAGRQTGNRQITVAFEEHGRDETGIKADISRTVGWFTNLYPVVLRAREDEEETIIAVKELMNKVGRISYEYGLLRSGTDLFDYMEADFSFNYLGVMDDSDQEDAGKTFEKCDLEVGSNISAKNILPGRYAVVFYISEKRMICAVSYNRKFYGREFSRTFLKAYREAITALTAYLSAKQETVQTLSDIEADDINQEELDELNDFAEALF